MNDSVPDIAEVTRAQQRASAPQSSAWVSAHAGSGKTHVLVNRVIRLLLDDADPARLLCITFTKAAAAEMANRLFGELALWAFATERDLTGKITQIAGIAPDRAMLARARRLFARALETPGGLKIQTIHAFCESILQRFPLEAGIVSGFEVLDERSAADLISDVRAEVLARTAGDGDEEARDALEIINAHVQEDGFEKLIKAVVDRRGELMAALEGADNRERLRARVTASLGAARDISAAGAITAIAGFDGVHIDMLKRWAEIAAKGGKQDAGRAQAISEMLAAGTAEERYEAYLSLFMTAGLFDAKRAPRGDGFVSAAVQKADPDLHGWLLDERERVATAYDRLKAARVIEATMALMVLSDRILSAYEARKQARAALDYDDLIVRTRALLSRVDMGWVLFKLDGGIDHILIDEAQDTSPEQWEIISYLAEEFFAGEGAREGVRTIFAVGDEKQSIYGFQGADPRRFAEMRAHFSRRVEAARLAFAPVDLTLSWRSTPEILDAVDRVFAGAVAARGLVADGAPLRHRAKRHDQPGRIEIWPTMTPDQEPERDPWNAPLDYLSPHSPDARLAERIAAEIGDWLTGGTMLAARGRPIRPGDILILVRRRNAFVEAMIRALKARDIPVAGADRMVLTDEIAVMDLIALGRFALTPEDDLNLAALLKSPLVGLDDDDLFETAHRRPASLWAALTGMAGDKPRFEAAVSRLNRWRAAADRTPPFEFYSRILDVDEDGAGTGRHAIRARLGPESDDPVNEFLALALQYEAHGIASLTGFLDWVVGGDAQVKRDMEHGGDQVRIMTVHGAKGLEANIVFLPDTCQVSDARNESQLMMLDAPDASGGTGPMAPVWAIARGYDTDAVTRARAEADARRDEEYRRLLYVAMTRACDWLYICGYETKTARPAACWYDLVASALIDRAEQITGRDGDIRAWRIEGTGTAVADDTGVADLPQPQEPAPPWLDQRLPDEPDPGGFLAPSGLTSAMEAGDATATGDAAPELPALNSPLSAGGADRRFQRGRLVHTLLQFLPGLPPDQRRARARAYLGQTAHALTPAMAREIEHELMAVLDDERFAGLFTHAALAEVPVAGSLRRDDGAPINVMGVIDRLVVTPAKVLIVDYKTNRPPPRQAGQVPTLYLRQMAAYAAIMANIYPDRPVECALLWTDGPALMALPADLLAEALLPVSGKPRTLS